MWILGIIASGVLKKITDTFTRTVSGLLGTADTGQTWTTLRGTWFANGSQAQSNDAGSTYALATVSLGSANATVSASVSGGVGVSFWATDSGSWFAVVPYYNQTSSSVYNACCTTTTVCSPNTYTNTTNYGAANCSPVSNTTYSSVGSASIDRPCPVGQDHISCTGTYFFNTCYAKTYTCPSGQYYNGAGSCLYTVGGYPSGVTPTCFNNATVAPYVYSCPYSCDQGSAVLGQDIGRVTNTCYCGTTTTTYTCTCSSGTPSCSSGCTSSSQTCSTTVTGSCSNPNCVACGGGTANVCNGCFETVYSQFYYLRMYSSVAGSVTQAVADVNVGQAIGSIKVITSGTGVTAQAYSGNLTGSIGNAMTHTSSATKGTSHGIIKTTSDYSQGSVADNFSAQV
jgi:hypothetical protein